MSFRKLIVQIASAGLAVAALAGCSSQSSQLTVQSLDNHHRYGQRFTEAFSTREQDGEYDVLLVQDGLKDRAPHDPTQPLEATDATPLRQVVHVHIFWRPEHGAKSNHPSATNSAIRWYVLGTTSASGSDVLRYQGAGFAKVYPSKNGVELDIRNTSMKLTGQSGNMTDPLGAASVTGTIFARTDAGRVQSLLNEIHKTETAAVSPAAAGIPTAASATEEIAPYQPTVVGLTAGAPARSPQAP